MSIAEKVKRIINFDTDAAERFMQSAHYIMSKCDYREELKGVAMCPLYTMPCEKVFQKAKCKAVIAWLTRGTNIMMTKGEAIKILQRIDRMIGDDFYSDTIDEAVEMAIEALKAQDRPIICPRCGRTFSEAEGRERDKSRPFGECLGVAQCKRNIEALKHAMSDNLISRAEAIEAIEIVDWYHQNRNKDMVSGANDDEHQAWYKADDVYKALEAVPSADRPRGEWIDENGTYYANCSKCGYQMDTHQERGYFRFCPNCGSDNRERSE